MTVEASARPDLSVLVVTHQGGEMALRVLRSARAAAGGAAVQWLVVDSGSTDGTPDAIERELPEVTVERRANIGFAAANNVGLARARGRYVLLLNPDMEIVEGTLAALVEALDRRPEVGAASVVQEWPDGGLQPTMRKFPSPLRMLGEAVWLSRLPALRHLQEEELRADRYGSERSADWLVGGFLLVRREVVEHVGGLDERFFLFSEEVDWCRRIRQAGWDVRHLPGMRAVHHTGRAARPDLYAQNSFSKVLYARKHFSAPGRMAFRAALIVRHAVRVAGFTPLAVTGGGRRQRLAAEALALRVVLGVTPPPFRPRS